MVFLALMALLTGCAPPGARALLEGKRLLEQGKFSQAVEKLRLATTLLNTNAQAWNYLGLACHQAGQVAEAEKAYHKALGLDHDLSEAHYNLGCLWLGQHRPEAAKAEFTAYTLRRGNAPAGFVKLGTAQLRAAQLEAAGPSRARELGAAEKSFNEGLSLDPLNPEALNGLGLVQVQRARAGEAVQFFNRALKQQPAYGPALLNLAIVEQEYLREPQAALQKYREYLALKPAPDSADAVKAVARQLEQELSPAPRPAATNAAVPTAPRSSPSTSAVANLTQARSEKTEMRLEAPKSPPPPAAVAIVKVAAEPVIRPAADPSPEPAQAAPLRYAYKSPGKPPAGNRPRAERWFAQGVQEQKARRLVEAVQAYRTATQVDPAYYEAYYNLGHTAADAGSLGAALMAYENALSIRPDSLDARYNFALTLKQANYLTDAAAELERVLAAYPGETRAHLALGNLYAQQFRQPARARPHYLKVLEADPNHPQAGNIRYWLAENPL